MRRRTFLAVILSALALAAGSQAVAGPTLPAAPTDLSFNGSETLTWTDNSDNEGGFRLVATIDSQVFRYEAAADVTTFTLPLEARIQCPTTSSVTYAVSAFNAAGESEPASLGIAVDCPPSAPTGIRIASGTLVWVDNSLDENGFQISVRIGGQTLEYQVDPNVTSWTIPPEARIRCPDRTTIVYDVAAFNTFGVSPSAGVGISALCPETFSTPTLSVHVLPPTGTGPVGPGRHSSWWFGTIALVASGVFLGWFALRRSG